MKSRRFLLATLILFLFASSAFTSQFYTPTGPGVQINPEVHPGNYPWINPGYTQIVEVCTPEKISIVEGETAFSPIVFENYVAWQQGDYIYLWKEGGPTVKTNIPGGSSLYDFSDNKIFYKYNGKFYLYDIIRKTIISVNIPEEAIKLKYDNNQIAYVTPDDNHQNNLYLQSGIANIKIKTYHCDFCGPISLHDGKIAWSEETDNAYLIFYWDGLTITQLTTGFLWGFSPSIHNGEIAWEGGTQYETTNIQIFYWNGNNITQITDTAYDNHDPHIYNGKIVWWTEKSDHVEIFYWNGEKIRQITNNNIYDLYPDIYNGRIAWVQTDPRVEGAHIYTCRVETPSKPTISYKPVTNRTSTSATLNGSVNPNGEATEYRFEYGTTTPYSSFTPWQSAGSGTTSVSVNATIQNLTPNTTYHYRLVAKNINGQTDGSDHTFKTLPPTPLLPTVTTGNVTGTDPYTLSGTVNPNGFETTFYFEYGTDTSYGNRTPTGNAGSGDMTLTVTAQVSGLQPNTTYHYRIVALNAAGTVVGEDRTFTTPREAMDVPSGQHSFTYLPVEEPVLNIDPASAKPFSVGDLMGGTLSLKVGLKAFKNPVDIYLGITYSGLPDDIFLIDSSNNLQQNTIVPWKTNQTEAIDESLFGDIDTDILPEGTYTLYTLVVPAGATNMDNCYLWITRFNILH